MTIQSRAQPWTVALVAWFAGHISCPVLRLRFLRTALPKRRPEYARRRAGYFQSWLLVSSLAVSVLFTVPAPRGRASKKFPRPSVKAPTVSEAVRVEQTPEIWQVEKTSAFDTYSNGLRIDNRYAVATRARSYLAFSTTHPGDIHGERRSVPAGIVFHTTESLQVPFEPEENAKLERIGESLLAYVKLRQAYNFVIDRFGRVYRVVEEGDAANHAGYSVWSDAKWVYLNLNESFLGVSFETRTLAGQSESTVNPAQIRSAALLTDMLRQRYGIAAANCVTHAQVSVNPDSLRIGYHLDWASSFPFGQLGLPDNYALPLPSVSLFGFQSDSDFAHRAGDRLCREAQLAEQVLRDRARNARLQIPAYRKILQQQYKSRLAVVRHGAGRAEREE